MDDEIKRLRTLFDKTIKQISTPLGTELTAAGHALTTALILAETASASLESALQSAKEQAQNQLTPDNESALQRTIIFEWLDAQWRRHNLAALQAVHAVLPKHRQVPHKARGNAKQVAEAIGHGIETAPNKRAEPAARERLNTAWHAIDTHSTGERAALIDIARRAQTEIKERVRRSNAERETLAMTTALAGLVGLDTDGDAAALFRQARRATNTEWARLPERVRKDACTMCEEGPAILSTEQLLDDGWTHTDDDWCPPENENDRQPTTRTRAQAPAKRRRWQV